MCACHHYKQRTKVSLLTTCGRNPCSNPLHSLLLKEDVTRLSHNFGLCDGAKSQNFIIALLAVVTSLVNVTDCSDGF